MSFRPSLSVCCLVLAAAAGSAHAVAATAVASRGGGDGSERCLVGSGAGSLCSGGAYDGALSLIGAFERDLGLPLGSFARIDDAADLLWSNTQAYGQVQARARYAADSSTLGYDAGSGYVNLTAPIDDADHRLVRVENRWDFLGDPKFFDFVSAQDAWLPITLPAGAPFAFVLHDLSTGQYFTSNPLAGVGSAGYANSASDFDHMVTFRVPDTMPHYFIAWEDRNPGDRDYNDLVVEVRYTAPLSAVPEPGTYGLLAAGLALLGWRRAGRAVRSSLYSLAIVSYCIA